MAVPHHICCHTRPAPLGWLQLITSFVTKMNFYLRSKNDCCKRKL
jgi:hypothetical protein